MSYLVDVKPKPIRRILSFDLEWSTTKDRYGDNPILGVGFCDSNGYEKAYILEDFMDSRQDKRSAEKALLSKIVKIISNYDWSVGFYSSGVQIEGRGRDSDLIQLHRRLLRYGMKSPIFISNRNNIPYLGGPDKDHPHVHIDTRKLFANETIKAAVYGNAYTAADLDSVSRAILGERGGKYDGISGAAFEMIADLEKKRQYVFLDAKLTMGCVANNEYELLKILNSIATLTNISFKSLCYSSSATRIWTPILDKLTRQELDSIDVRDPNPDKIYQYDMLSTYYSKPDDPERSLTTKKKTPDFIGGLVHENPVPGKYNNIYVFDVTSMYPTIIVNHNISFDTEGCLCCVDNPDANAPYEIYDYDMNVNLHICRKRQGVLTKQIIEYMKKRIEFKKLSKEEKDPKLAREYEIISNAYKIVINSAYGQLGSNFSKYRNKKAAEMVTRYGRFIINECANLAEMFGWAVIYGDTDSIFVANITNDQDITQFIDTCKAHWGVTIGIDKIYEELLLYKPKNYLGILKSNKKLVVKGFAGIKKNRCLWVRNAFKQMLQDYRKGIDPCINLREEIRKLEDKELENMEFQLLHSESINLDIEEYDTNTVHKVFGLKYNLQKGDSVRFYKKTSTSKDKGGFTDDLNKISVKEYEIELINTVKPILTLIGYDVNKDLHIGYTQLDMNLAQFQAQEPMELPVGITVNGQISSIKEKTKNMKPKANKELIQI